MKTTIQLQQALANFVTTLTPDQRLLFKDVCDALAHSYYEVGEVLKCVAIDLIPSKIGGASGRVESLSTVGSSPTSSTSFKPQVKTKGDPLQELVSSMPEAQRRSLIEKLQQSTKENDTK